MICKKCQLDQDDVLYSNADWTLMFGKQDYLGRCVLVSKRHIDSFTKLTDKETLSFKSTLNKIEQALKNLYGCSLLNWCCNMNNSVDDPHLHIHIRPRYRNTVKINNTIYQDKEWGKHYDRFAIIQFNEEDIKTIFEDFKKEMNK